jgi:hypothetical protein
MCVQRSLYEEVRERVEKGEGLNHRYSVAWIFLQVGSHGNRTACRSRGEGTGRPPPEVMPKVAASLQNRRYTLWDHPLPTEMPPTLLRSHRRAVDVGFVFLGQTRREERATTHRDSNCPEMPNASARYLDGQSQGGREYFSLRGRY